MEENQNLEEHRPSAAPQSSAPMRQGRRSLSFGIVLLCVGVVALLGVAAYVIWRQQQTITEMTGAFELEKQALEDEYEQLAIQYEGYEVALNNDSLEQKLEDQRLKIQRLVEELKQTKAQDARRINQLKKELETVRSSLKYYVAQVDSLNRENAELRAENLEMSGQLQAANRENAAIQQRNRQLTEKVTLAAQLTAANLRAVGLNKREKETDRIKQVSSFRIDFTIAANVTAEIGEKDVYCRILTPDEDLLTNDRSGRFAYDGAQVGYSMKKTIEYGGQEMVVTLYWKRGETLSPGAYRVEVYADGSLIGTTTMTLRS